VVAAGDAFLSYGEHAKAAGFYEKALGMAGVDTNLVLTRLGIAQTGAGNVAAAREAFAKVQGVRAPVAMLWSAYAEQQSAPATGG
jgi:predicted TPR repeat methyltransferase